MSTGWVCGVLAQAAVLGADAIKLIKALLTLGHLLHADETTGIGAERRWLHVAATETLTFLALAPRSRAGAEGLGILPGLRGVLVHDSLSLYAAYDQARHQLCGTHLIRELTAAAEDHPGQMWPAQVRWALAELHKQAKAAKDAGRADIPPERALVYVDAFHHGVAVGLSLHPRVPGRAPSRTRDLLERLRDRAGDILRFVEDPLHVPMTNNPGERDLRPVKTQIKVSGCHQSEAGAAAWLAVRSDLSTAGKHGLNALETLRRAFTGSVWMPPIALA